MQLEVPIGHSISVNELVKWTSDENRIGECGGLIDHLTVSGFYFLCASAMDLVVCATDNSNSTL